MNTYKFFHEMEVEETKKINGGFLEPIGIGIGIVAGLIYCYEFGYNYAKERL